MEIVSFIVFAALQIIMLPLAILGAVVVTYKQLVVSKRLGVSQTAIEVLNGRWTMHIFGIRGDFASAKLANTVPNTSTFGLWLVLFPLWVKHKLSGKHFGYPRIPEEGEEGIADMIVARTLYFDRIIERVARDVEQFVVFGAGFDARAYGALSQQGLVFFELDQAETQKLKIQSLRAAGINTGHVTFVEVDFSKGNVFQTLIHSGYDPSKKSLFLWEGVTLYLSEEDVRKTLQNIQRNAAPGSVIVADFYGERMLRMGNTAATKKTLEYTNEGFGFGLPFASNFESCLNEFLQSERLAQGECYFMGKSSPKGPFMVVVEIMK